MESPNGGRGPTVAEAKRPVLDWMPNTTTSQEAYDESQRRVATLVEASKIEMLAACSAIVRKTHGDKSAAAVEAAGLALIEQARRA